MNPSNEKAPLLIVGSVAFDSIETPNGRVDMALGGSASYAAIAASYFARPQVVGIVGSDFGDDHMRRLTDHGIDVSGIESVAGKTFHWRGKYHEDFKQRDTLETALNVFETFSPTIPELFRDTQYLFLGNIDPKLQLSVLDQTRGAKLVAMDTMNFWIETARDDLIEVLKRVDILFINDEEALQLSDEWTVLAAAEKILQWGPKYVVIKRGEYGSLIFGPDVLLSVPAVLLSSVVDPTGAGDTFAGGFLGHLTTGVPLDRANLAGALMMGTVLASFTVEAFSVDGVSDLTRDTIGTRHARLESMIRF